MALRITDLREYSKGPSSSSNWSNFDAAHHTFHDNGFSNSVFVVGIREACSKLLLHGYSCQFTAFTSPYFCDITGDRPSFGRGR